MHVHLGMLVYTYTCGHAGIHMCGNLCVGSDKGFLGPKVHIVKEAPPLYFLIGK